MEFLVLDTHLLQDYLLQGVSQLQSDFPLGPPIFFVPTNNQGSPASQVF
jgi:hypothetical protein